MKQINEAYITEYFIPDVKNDLHEEIKIRKHPRGYYVIEGTSGISILSEQGKWIDRYEYVFKEKTIPQSAKFDSIEKAYNKFAKMPFDKIEISNIWEYLANEETKAAVKQANNKWFAESADCQWYLDSQGHLQDCKGFLTLSQISIMEFDSFEEALEAAEKIAAEDIAALISRRLKKMQFNKKM
jgi:hypothetical protein